MPEAITPLDLGTNDVARILGTTPRTVTRMCQRGEITHYVVGKRSIRFRPREVGVGGGRSLPSMAGCDRRTLPSTPSR